MISGLAAIGGVLALALALARLKSKEDSTGDFVLVTGVLVFCLLSVAGWSPRFIGPTRGLDRAGALAFGALALFVFVAGRIVQREWVRRVVVASVLAATTLLGLGYVNSAAGAGIDVVALHIAASEAIEQGLNPYTSVVSVEDGSPLAEPGDTIDGYVYPPLTAVGYSIGEWTLGDPRYVSLVAWIGFLAIVGRSAIAKDDGASLLVLLLAASAPGWPLVLRSGWTEPLSLVLLGLAFRSWARPVGSGVMSGLALASKQYFAVVAPVLLFFRDDWWRKRVFWTLGVIIFTIGIGLAWDPAAFWSAAVEFHLNTPPRPDSLNLIGLAADLGIELDFPSLLPILIGLVVGALTGRWARTRSEWLLAIGMTLAASFLVSSQAFVNYWFLILGLIALAMTDLATDSAPSGV